VVLFGKFIYTCGCYGNSAFVVFDFRWNPYFHDCGLIPILSNVAHYIKYSILLFQKTTQVYGSLFMKAELYSFLNTSLKVRHWYILILRVKLK
jgi:hypothetical protein